MPKEMLINVSEGEECRIAIVEKGRLEELYMERTSATSHVGNIYKGRVTNVEPSIQAAFIDFGLGRNGFLHISDLMPTYFGRAGEDIQESVGRKMARRDRPPIQRCLRRGDEIIVQIIKEGIGTKGPTLSTYLSIPGRILVMMPGMSKLGVSRKIEDEEERRRLRKILDELRPPKDSGFIIRTAGVGKSKQDIGKDLQYLTRLWQNVERKLRSGPGPMELYTEGDLVTRTVRDVFTPEIERVLVDNKEVADRVSDFFKIAMPRTKAEIVLHEKTVPLFHEYGIEREIEQMYSRYVPLPSGGSLVIDSTEAIVAIDVNSGKFRDHADAEMTAFKTDLEAADEIPRQLRLRDLGGVIICDFIDLRYERHRRELEKKLHDNLRDDRAKTKMLRMSQFGIIEMTRQRMRPSLKRSIYFDCPHCHGAGLVKTAESMALDMMRRLAIAINDARVARIDLAVCPEVAMYLQNKKRAQISDLEEKFAKRISIRPDQNLGMDAMQLELWDARDGLVFIDELGMLPPAVQPGGRHMPHAQQPQRGQRPQHGQRRPEGADRGGERRDGRGGQRGRDGRGDRDRGRSQGGERGGGERHERSHEQEDYRESDERFDIDRVEEEVEEREVELRESAAEGRSGRRGQRHEHPAPPVGEAIDAPPPPMEEQETGAVEEYDRGGDEADLADDREQPAGPPAGGADRGGPGRADMDDRSGANNNGSFRSGRRRGRRGRGRGRGRGQDFSQEPQRQPETPFEQREPAEESALEREPEMFEPMEPEAEFDRREIDAPPEPIDEPAAEALREPEPAPEPAASVEGGDLTAPEPEPEADAPAKGRRGSRSRSRKPKEAAATGEASEETLAQPKKRAKTAKKTAPRSSGGRRRKSAAADEAAAEPSAAPAQPAPEVRPPVAGRSGADRHLVRDEPVIPPPVSRPRTYRDLDHIPDDLD